MKLTLRSCKHEKNIVTISKKWRSLIINWEWFSSWSSKKQLIVNSVVEKVNIWIYIGNDGDITINFDEWRTNIPIVIGNQANNAGDVYNNCNLHSKLLDLKIIIDKWMNYKERLLNLLV